MQTSAAMSFAGAAALIALVDGTAGGCFRRDCSTSDPFTAVQNFELAHCSPVGAKPVSDDLFGPAVAFQRLQKDQGGCFVAHFRDEALEYLALVIDRAPQVVGSPLILTNTSSGCQRQ